MSNCSSPSAVILQTFKLNLSMNCTKLHYCLFPEKQFSAGDKASLTKVKFFRNNDASCLRKQHYGIYVTYPLPYSPALYYGYWSCGAKSSDSFFKWLLMYEHFRVSPAPHNASISTQTSQTIRRKPCTQKHDKKENNARTFTHGACIVCVCVCVCRTKPGKKNDVEAVETRSELHSVTRVESAQNVKKMQFKSTRHAVGKRKKHQRLTSLFFLSDELQRGFVCLLLDAKTQW